MSMNRTQTSLALIILAIGLLLAAILGLFAYMTITAKPLHPDPHSVPSATHSDPSRKWVNAVERGRQVMREGLTEQNLPGLSVAVGVDGDIVWAEGFGWADLDSRVPVTPDTRFRIGTASMALTSAGVGLLLEKNRLKLDDAIQTYVPEFPQKEWPVTLRQLMGHTAGVRSDSGDEGPLFSQHCCSSRGRNTAIPGTAGSWSARPSKPPPASRSSRSCGSRSSIRCACTIRGPTH